MRTYIRTVCANSAQPELIQKWKAAGKKILLSFGGAGMGGSGFELGPESGDRVGVAMGLGVIIVGKGAIVVGDAGPGISQVLPAPLHLLGKKRRTSSVVVSSNCVANF